jgi:hypothetical protein
MDYKLYVTINTINGKVYGGKHFYRLPKSLKYKGSGHALRNAFVKYGIDNFEVRWFKLKINTPEDLNRLEIKLIRRLHRKFGRKNCYNIHKGGTGAGYTEYMTPEEILEVNKKVSDGLKEMYKDPIKKNNWRESLKKRKHTMIERTKLYGKSEKELRKIQYVSENGRVIVNYKIIFPNGDELVESKCIKHFMEKYKTDDFIFRKAKKNGSYLFNRVTKLSRHPFPRGTVIYYISEENTFNGYKNEETGGSSVPPVSV